MLTTLVGNVFPPLAALVTAPILAHTLGVDGRGQVAAAMAPYLLLTTVAALGIPEAVTYAIARQPLVAVRATRLGLLIVGGLGLVMVVIVVCLGDWLSGGSGEIRNLIVLASLAIAPSLCLGVIRGTASGLHCWGMVARERLLTGIARLVAIGTLSLAGLLTPLSATIALAVTPLLGGVAYFGLPRLVAIRESRATPELAEEVRIVRFGARVWVGAMAGILLMRVDQTLMLPLTTAYQLGLYVVAVTVAELPLIVNSAVRDVTFASEATAQSEVRLTASARISSCICILISAPLAAVVPLCMPVLFGSSFSAAVPSTLILILGVVVSTHGSVAGAGLSGRGRPGLRSASLLGACGVNLALLFYLVPAYGAIGAAWATLVGSAVFTLLCILFMKLFFDVSVRSFFGVRRTDVDVVSTQFLKLRKERA